MKPIRVLVLAQVPPPVHGAAVINKAVIDCLSTRTNCNVEHENISASRSISDMQRGNLSKIFSAARVLLAVLVRLLKVRRDLIYINASPQGFSAYRDLLFVFLSCLRSDRVLAHFHGKVGDRSIFGRSWVLWILSRKVEYIFLDRALVPSCFVPGKSYHVLQNFSPAEKQLLGLSCDLNEVVSVCFLANMLPAKGINTVLEVCARVLRGGERFSVHLAGGWTRKYSVHDYHDWLAKNQDVAAHFTHWGAVGNEEKQKLFRVSDIFLYPTKNDAFPLVVLEAMASGLAVVASNVGAIGNIVGHSGFLACPDNVEQFVNNLELLLLNPSVLSKEKDAMKQRYRHVFMQERFEYKLLSIFGV